MAKQLIPEELNELIQEYLTDGILTDKERQVILRKAESMGLDRDEIDLYLDAQVQKIDQATDAAVRRQKGNLCPFCGASIPQFSDKCPECNQLITPQATEELKEILDKLEESLFKIKSNYDYKLKERHAALMDRYIRKANLYYGNNPKVKTLLSEIEAETKSAKKSAKTKERNKKLTERFTYGGCILVIIIALIIFFLPSFFIFKNLFNILDDKTPNDTKHERIIRDNEESLDSESEDEETKYEEWSKKADAEIEEMQRKAERDVEKMQREAERQLEQMKARMN